MNNENNNLEKQNFNLDDISSKNYESVPPVAPIDTVEPMPTYEPVSPVAPVAPIEPMSTYEPVPPVAPVAPVEPMPTYEPVMPVDSNTSNYDNYYNDFPKEKKSSNLLIPILVLIVILAIIIGFSVSKENIFSNIINKVKYPLNVGVDNLKIHVPKTWTNYSGKYISKSGNCTVMGASISEFKENYLEQFESQYGKFSKRTINGKVWNYSNFQAEGVDSYVYIMDNESDKYMVMFGKKDDTDKECNEYLKILEKTLTVKK